MAVTSTQESAINQISSSYQSTEQEKTSQEEALGREAFLTMLVAQLENQDPLNPMDGTDFSAQLAQFSQLEQLMNLNESMDALSGSFAEKSEDSVMQYLGKQVTGNVDTMNVDEGTVSGGFYSLTQPSDVMISITDADGNTVKTLYDGQQNAGSHLISWDGTDNNGDAVEDGTYHYTVQANSGYGYVNVDTTVTGEVEGIAYNNGSPYLVVQGILLDPESLTAVMEGSQGSDSEASESALTYLGRTVSSNSPIVLVEDDAVQGGELEFELDAAENVTVTIYDAYDEAVRTITLSADETSGGENSVLWDGLADSGYHVSDGMYYYTVKGASGFASTGLSEEVAGIKYMNGSQYLVMADSGRLVALSAINGIN